MYQYDATIHLRNLHVTEETPGSAKTRFFVQIRHTIGRYNILVIKMNTGKWKVFVTKKNKLWMALSHFYRTEYSKLAKLSSPHLYKLQTDK